MYERIYVMQKISYRTARTSWNFKSGFGNHRMIVETPAGEYVRVELPWRRRDLNPANMGVRVCYTPAGDPSRDGIGSVEIRDVTIEHADRDIGVIVFRAPEAGEYEIYYMPFTMPGEWYAPEVFYLEPSEMEPDIEWLTGLGSAEVRRAEVKCYECRTEFDSFYPMEVRMTDGERRDFMGHNPFRAVAESRTRQVRMKSELPLIWAERDPSDIARLRDTAYRNEHYVFQVAVCANVPLENVAVRFTDGNGRELSQDECVCFNLDGLDADGNVLKIHRDVAVGEVLPLWCGIRAELFDFDMITVHAAVSADNTDYTEEVTLTLDVRPDEIVRNGDDDLWRLSRLFWLNSDIGISDRAIAPYTPVEIEHDLSSVSVLGRRISVGQLGLPSGIRSSFDDRCRLDGDADPIELLAAPISLSVKADGENLPVLQLGDARLTPGGEAEATVSRTAECGGLRLDSEITYECDGHIDCMIRVRAESAGEYSFELCLPVRTGAAPYMMGMCREGGRVPNFWEYTWDRAHHGALVWLGGARAGIQLKLMPEDERWGHSLPFPRLWYNGGCGGMRLRTSHEHGVIDLRAFTGNVHLDEGDEEVLHFHLIVTPFHPVDYNTHWTEHYYQKNSWHSDEPIPSLENAKKFGTKTVILHQGGPLNENINYPFVLAPKLKAEVDRAHAMGLYYKIYYTVRELSNYTTEIWALRALGDEIFYTGEDFHIADFFMADADKKVRKRPRGGPWLIEHLVEGFTAAWHQFLQNGEYDCAIATQHKSRWHNYYLAGLDWLCRVVGIDGLYLDGIGYDRHIMRRVRRVIMDAKGRCDIDIHCGNTHAEVYGQGVSACNYLEHFAYADNIWNGEGYEYNSESPEYQLIEVSGLTFGVMGEMLERGGNPWRGMLYGMTARCGWSQGGVSRPIWDVWERFGMTEAAMYGFWHPQCPVTVENDNVPATAYVKENGDAMIVLASWYNMDRPYSLVLDREMLKIDGDFELFAPEIPDVQPEAHFPGGALMDVEVASGQGWILLLRRL